MRPTGDLERSSKPTETPKSFWGLLVLAVATLAGGLAARAYFLEHADSPTEVPAPHRKGLPAPFITSQQMIVNKMVELAELSEDDLVYDLGCGDGRIVITAAAQSGCRGVGFDIDPKLVALSRENAKKAGVDGRVTFKEQDVFKVDLSEADVAMAYLLPWMLEKMRPQFVKMKPGARIVLHDYWIEGVEPDEYVEIDLKNNGTGVHGIYVYHLPLKLNPNMERLKPPRPRGWKAERRSEQSPEPTDSESSE